MLSTICNPPEPQCRLRFQRDTTRWKRVLLWLIRAPFPPEPANLLPSSEEVKHKFETTMPQLNALAAAGYPCIPT